MFDWLESQIVAITKLAPDGYFGLTFNIKCLIAVILVSLICGAVGSIVVGNRMAFFSDALVHCAWAGAALGFLLGYLGQAAKESEFYITGIPMIMVALGIIVGAGIAFVRDKSGLASDTVIGVFFATAIGVGSLILAGLLKVGYFPIEQFLFGDPLSVSVQDLFFLMVLIIITGGVVMVMYNSLVFTSFSASLARSRRLPVVWCNYAFIILLALIVNLALRIVGAMLINALLIVPAATAALLSRNMRQLFWMTIGLSLFSGLAGIALNWEMSIHLRFATGIGGPIVVLAVILFFLAVALRPWLYGQQAKA
jgi:zinc transport system permease protein